MGVPDQSWDYPAGPLADSPGPDVATWDSGSLTLTDTVIADGTFLASFAGQCYANLNAPLPGWANGNPS